MVVGVVVVDDVDVFVAVFIVVGEIVVVLVIVEVVCVVVVLGEPVRGNVVVGLIVVVEGLADESGFSQIFHHGL